MLVNFRNKFRPIPHGSSGMTQIFNFIAVVMHAVTVRDPWALPRGVPSDLAGRRRRINLHCEKPS